MTQGMSDLTRSGDLQCGAIVDVHVLSDILDGLVADLRMAQQQQWVLDLPFCSHVINPHLLSGTKRREEESNEKEKRGIRNGREIIIS